MRRVNWVVPLVMSAGLLASGCGMTMIEDGQVGVRADFGSIKD